jgi:hypothetical protein
MPLSKPLVVFASVVVPLTVEDETGPEVVAVQEEPSKTTLSAWTTDVPASTPIAATNNFSFIDLPLFEKTPIAFLNTNAVARRSGARLVSLSTALLPGMRPIFDQRRLSERESEPIA